MKIFKDIIAWQKAYKLTLNLYQFTANFPRNEEFGLKSQMRRASVSVVSNIAEGFKRNTIKDKLRFYNQAQTSLEELKCQCMLSSDLKYFDLREFKVLEKLADETGKVLNGWIASQKYR